MALGDRKARVLRAVVEEHIETGQPVGSRIIAKRYRLGVSPATIRNEMADLEETGYLDKPHTSSGRVPSDLGYRFYVDELMPEKGLTPEESQAVEALFRTKVKDVVTLLRETVRLVSLTSTYIGFVLGPDADDVALKSIHLLPQGPHKALLVLVTDVGFIETCQIEVPDARADDLHMISQTLTWNLEGAPLHDVGDRAYRLLRDEQSKYARVVEQVVEFLRSVTYLDTDRLYVGGAANLLSQPEFQDVDKVRAVMSAIEEGGVIRALFPTRVPTKEPAIRIGAEVDMDAVRYISMVYGTFGVGRALGTVGILGPRRMDYPKAVAIVRMFEHRLSRHFSRGE